MYHQIVFDVDGTLLDSCLSISRGLQRTAKEITGWEVPLSLAIEAFAMPSRPALRHVGISEEDMARGLDLFDRYSYSCGEGSVPFPGVTDLLEELTRLKVPLYVFSARLEDEFDHDTSFHPIAHYFRRIMGTGYAGVPKPAPDGLLRFLREEGAAASEVLMVGDSSLDSASAAGAGIDFALAGWNPAVQPEAIPHTYLLRDPGEMLGLIE